MRSVYHTDSKPTFSQAEIKQIMKQTAEPIATQEATERIVRILDSKYEKVSQPMLKISMSINRRNYFHSSKISKIY
jgi:hypothetical protein